MPREAASNQLETIGKGETGVEGSENLAMTDATRKPNGLGRPSRLIYVYERESKIAKPELPFWSRAIFLTSCSLSPQASVYLHINVQKQPRGHDPPV